MVEILEILNNQDERLKNIENLLSASKTVLNMDEVSTSDLKKAMSEVPEKADNSISDEEFERMLKTMENPVDSLREMAVKIKIFLDKRIKAEMNSEQGILTDHTRRWVESYEKILEKIQKALHGDKSVNLHVHKISHKHIGAKMRESVIILEEAKKSEKKGKKEK